MEPTRSDQILDEWSSVARSATPPGSSHDAVTTGVAGAGISLAGAAVLVVALVAAFAVLGNRPSQSGPAGLPTASPSPSPSVAVAIPAPPTPEPTATAAPTPTLTPTPSPSLIADCNPADLATQITLWEGAAGSRIGHVQLTNNGSGTCSTADTWQPVLVDGQGEPAGQFHDPVVRTVVPAEKSRLSIHAVNNYILVARVAREDLVGERVDIYARFDEFRGIAAAAPVRNSTHPAGMPSRFVPTPGAPARTAGENGRASRKSHVSY